MSSSGQRTAIAQHRYSAVSVYPCQHRAASKEVSSDSEPTPCSGVRNSNRSIGRRTSERGAGKCRICHVDRPTRHRHCRHNVGRLHAATSTSPHITPNDPNPELPGMASAGISARSRSEKLVRPSILVNDNCGSSQKRRLTGSTASTSVIYLPMYERLACSASATLLQKAASSKPTIIQALSSSRSEHRRFLSRVHGASGNGRRHSDCHFVVTPTRYPRPRRLNQGIEHAGQLRCYLPHEPVVL